MFDRATLATDEQVENGEAGLTLTDVGRAVMIWASMNSDSNRVCSVAAAAIAFNTSPDLIREAVAASLWAYLVPPDEPDPSKQEIGVDGE